MGAQGARLRFRDARHGRAEFANGAGNLGGDGGHAGAIVTGAAWIGEIVTGAISWAKVTGGWGWGGRGENATYNDHDKYGR